MKLRRFASTMAVAAIAVVLGGCADGGGVVGVLQGGGAGAACAAPEVSIDLSTVIVGKPATLTATNLTEACNDQGEGLSAPAKGMTVSLEAVDGSWGPLDVATVDAAADFTASATFRVPRDTAPGWVNVLIDGEQLSTVEVVAP